MLSGLDYPVYSSKRFDEFFAQNRDKEFVCGYDISLSNNKRQLRRIVLYHYFRDIPLPHNSFLRRAIIVGTRILFHLLGVRKKPFVVIDGNKWDVFYGFFMGFAYGGVCRVCVKAT